MFVRLIWTSAVWVSPNNIDCELYLLYFLRYIIIQTQNAKCRRRRRRHWDRKVSCSPPLFMKKTKEKIRIRNVLLLFCFSCRSLRFVDCLHLTCRHRLCILVHAHQFTHTHTNSYNIYLRQPSQQMTEKEIADWENTPQLKIVHNTHSLARTEISEV